MDRKGKRIIATYLDVLYRRRWIALLNFLVVVGSVVLHTLMTLPMYEASGLIQVKDKGHRSAFLSDQFQLPPSSTIRSEIEVLKSRSLAKRVVEKLRLDLRISHKNPEDLPVRMKNVNMANRHKGKAFEINLDKDGGFSLLTSKGVPIGEGTVGTPFEADEISFTLECPDCGWGEFLFQVMPYRMVVFGIRNVLAVERLGEAGILRISYRSRNPKQARDIVNTYIDLYIKQDLEYKIRQATLTLDFVEQQRAKQEKEFQDRTQALADFKTTHGIASLGDEALSLVNQATRFEVEKSQLDMLKRQFEIFAKSFTESPAGVEIPDFASSDVLLMNLSLQLTELISQRRQLLADLTEKHPAILAMDEQIASQRGQIQAALQSTIQSVQRRSDDLQSVIKEYKEVLGTLPGLEGDLAELERKAAVAKQISLFLSEKFQEAKIAHAIGISNIRVIDRAVAPAFPYSPDMKRNILIGLLVAFLYAFAVAFFMEFVDDSLKTVDEVESRIGLPLLGTIHRISPELTVATGKELGKSLVTRFAPKSPTAESFRTLRTNLEYSFTGARSRAILITSAAPSEGKSTIAANLAVTMAESGKKTLLVDCDLRKPNLHNLFACNRDPGFSDQLVGERSSAEVLRETGVKNLFLLTSGPIPPNPSEVLGSKKLADQIRKWLENYDRVIIDSPPAVVVTDAALLSTMVNAVLLVVELGRSRLGVVRQAQNALEKVKAPLMGIITNNIASEYGYGYKYGYEYYYRRKKSESNETKNTKSRK